MICVSLLKREHFDIQLSLCFYFALAVFGQGTKAAQSDKLLPFMAFLLIKRKFSATFSHNHRLAYIEKLREVPPQK